MTLITRTREEPAEAAELEVSDPALGRFRGWLAHAPAERLPLPLIPAIWTATEIMHTAGVRGLFVGGAAALATAVAGWMGERHARNAEHPHLAGMEVAAVTAATGAWVTAGTGLGPLAGPDHLLSGLYLAATGGGYWWLRRHDAVQAARKRRDEAAELDRQRRDDLAAEIADKTLWHQYLPRAGLGGWHVQWRRTTNLGEERLITTSPENASAKRTATSSSVISEKLEHVLGLPYGRVDLTTTGEPGQLIIGIRKVDLSTQKTIYHPLTDPWPGKEPSRFADWFPPVASIRDPVIWGVRPEDGTELVVELVSRIGGRAVGVLGATGSGKSNVLNVLREFVTRCPDARMVQLNGAHMGDELTWEPLSALTLCGSVATDPELRAKIGAVLEALELLVTQRTASLAKTGHSTFQPTEADPAVIIFIDEVDEVVANVPGAGRALGYLASKMRKAAVGLVLATQRGVLSALGDGMVRANMTETLIGVTARASESRHATGAETDIPDISEYSKGQPGYFTRWNPLAKTTAGRGRSFQLGVDPDELAYIKRLVAGRQHLRDWNIPDMPPLALDGEQATVQHTTDDVAAQRITGLRARLAGIATGLTGDAERTTTGPATATATVPLPIPLEIPQADGQTLLRLLAQPDGVSAKEAGEALGKSRSRAGDYLRAMANREPPIAVRTGSSRASRYRLVRPGEAQPEPAAARPDAYVTLDSAIKTLTEAVRNGLDVDDDTRAVLEQAQQIGDQPPARPHLTVVPDVPDPERSDAL